MPSAGKKAENSVLGEPAESSDPRIIELRNHLGWVILPPRKNLYTLPRLLISFGHHLADDMMSMDLWMSPAS